MTIIPPEDIVVCTLISILALMINGPVMQGPMHIMQFSVLSVQCVCMCGIVWFERKRVINSLIY